MSQPLPSKTNSRLQRVVLREVLCQFIQVAEKKLRDLEYVGLEQNEDISIHLDAGMDKEFDAKMETVAVIAKHFPKLIIDFIMIWRSSHNAEDNDFSAIREKHYPHMTMNDLKTRIQKRNSYLSNFVLGRVLTRIIQNLQKEDLSLELGKKLENMVFSQLRYSEPSQVRKYANLEANLRIFSELLGTLSELRFDSIADNFISELKLANNDEAKIEMLLKCMRPIKLKLYPIEAIDETADFLQALAELFNKENNPRIVNSFCDLFIFVLEPIAKVADAELNVPILQRTIELIVSGAKKMVAKSKSLNISLHLMTSLLAVSTKENFWKNWFALVEILVSKFKEKALRSTSLECLCRLIWVYLFRCSESPSSVVERRIDYFAKTLFPRRRATYPGGCDLDIFVRIVYFMLVKYPEYSNDFVIKHLISAEMEGDNSYPNSRNNSKTDIPNSISELIPSGERILIVIRAYLLFLKDVEKSLEASDKDQIPTTLGLVSVVPSNSGTGRVFVEGKISLGTPKYPDLSGPTDYSISKLNTIGQNDLNSILCIELKNRMGQSIGDTLDMINLAAGSTLNSLHSVVGKYFFFSGKGDFDNSIPGSNIGSSSSSVIETLNTFTGVQTRQDPINEPESRTGNDAFPLFQYRLLRTIIDGIPRINPAGISANVVIEMLATYLFHRDINICKAAFEALCRIAKIKRKDIGDKEWDLGVWNEMPSAAVVEITSKTIESLLIHNLFEAWCSDKLGSYLARYSENLLALLNIWLDEIRSINHTPTLAATEDIFRIVEGHGLLFLLEPLPLRRSVGIKILNIAKEFKSTLNGKRNAEDIVDKSNTPVDEINDSRLSTFQKGRRASTIFKYSKMSKLNSGDNVDFHYISIYDIIVDQGIKLLKENYVDPMSRPEIKENSSESTAGQEKLFSLENPLIHVAISSEKRDIAIWNRCFPHLLKYLLKFANQKTLKYCLGTVWKFLKAMGDIIIPLSGSSMATNKSFNTLKKMERLGLGLPSDKYSTKLSQVSSELLIENWRSLLIFAYSGIGIICDDNDQYLTSEVPYGIRTASELNRNILQLISCDRYEIRKAAVVAAGCIQPSGYQVMLKDILPQISRIVAKSLSMKQGAKPDGNEYKLDRVRTEITYLLSFISSFAEKEVFRMQRGIMNSIQEFIQAMLIFFNEPNINLEWKHQMTRYYFCVFIERYYRALTTALKNKSNENIEDYFSFQLRRQVFALFELWCGFGLDSSISKKREAEMMSLVLDPIKDHKEKDHLTKKMEVHRKSIQLASLKAIGALLKGPLQSRNESIEFEVNRVTAWINALLESSFIRYQKIASSAIESILTYNPDSTKLFEDIIENCYIHPGHSNITIGYFNGLVDLITKEGQLHISMGTTVCLALFHMGSESVFLRKAASRLLISVDRPSGTTNTANEDQFFNDYNIDFDDDAQNSKQEFTFETAAIVSSLPTVYKHARLVVSQRLAAEKPNLVTEVISELTRRIKIFHFMQASEKCKDLLEILAPWCCYAEIGGDFSLTTNSEDPKELAATTWTIINNLIYLTAIFGGIYGKEIELLWKNLSQGVLKTDSVAERQKMVTKINTIIDILILKNISGYTASEIAVAKSISVYICRKGCGKLYLDLIIAKLTPENLTEISDQRTEEIISAKCKPARGYFIATLPVVESTTRHKSHHYSLVFLNTVLLVDAIHEIDFSEIARHLPVLLTTIFLFLDAEESICEQMRLLLVNLIQSSFKQNDPRRSRIDAVLNALYQREGKAVWKYEDNQFKHSELESTGQMNALAKEMLELFYHVSPLLETDWLLTALYWGTVLINRHISCRALQLFRCLNSKPNIQLCTLLLNSLINTVATDVPEKQIWGFELCQSVASFVPIIEPEHIYTEFSALFWAGYSLLYSCHEWEYHSGVLLIRDLLDAINLNPGCDLSRLFFTIPKSLTQSFDGLLPLFCRGLNSSAQEKYAIECINALLLVKPAQLLYGNRARFLFVALANLPRLLLYYPSFVENSSSIVSEIQCIRTSEILAKAAEESKAETLNLLFTKFSQNLIPNATDMIRHIAYIISEEYPESEWEAIRFCVSLLTNRAEHYRKCYLYLLELLLQKFSSRASDMPAIDEDWLHPLLALLDGPFYSSAAMVLDGILTGQAQSTEEDITSAVGGPSSMYKFVKKSLEKKASTKKLHSETGWPYSKTNDSALIKSVLLNISKPLNTLAPLLKERSDPVKDYVYSSKKMLSSKAGLVLEFQDLEKFYSNAIQ